MPIILAPNRFVATGWPMPSPPVGGGWKEPKVVGWFENKPEAGC